MLQHPRGRLQLGLEDRSHHSCPILGGGSDVAGHRCPDAAKGPATGAEVEVLAKCRCAHPDTDERCSGAMDGREVFCSEYCRGLHPALSPGTGTGRGRPVSADSGRRTARTRLSKR